ncbi:TPA: hypothetical protein ACWWUK_000175 [Citrobacter youngae]
MTNKPEQLPEWRKSLNEAVENYQSTRAWYEENQDSPSAEQDMDAAAGEIAKLIKQYGVLIVLNLLDEIDELQERRKAERDSEPVAVVEPSDYVTAAQLVGECPARKAVHELYEGALRIGDKLYRHATPAPVVPENCVTAEHRRVIEMLLNVCGAAFELADDSCQQDVDGEECHVVQNDAFEKLSDALDEIENTLPTEDADRPDVFLAWSAMPRAALKSILQAGNSPVTPDGWQLVPKEPTQAMNKAGWDAMNEHDAINPTYRAMLAAAPKQENI